jgi:hypothetical protein
VTPLSSAIRTTLPKLSLSGSAEPTPTSKHRGLEMTFDSVTGREKNSRGYLCRLHTMQEWADKTRRSELWKQIHDLGLQSNGRVMVSDWPTSKLERIVAVLQEEGDQL